ALHDALPIYVVHHGRAAEEAGDGGEGGLETGPALLALDGLDEAGLLTADVGAGAAHQVDVQREVGAHGAGAEDSGLVGLLDRRLHPLRLELELAAQVDVRLVRADRLAGDADALEHQVRLVLEDVAVLEGPRLGLVAVHREVARLGVVLGDEAPLESGRDARAAPAAQVALLHLVDDGRRLHPEHALEAGIAPTLGAVLREEVAVFLAPGRADDGLDGRRGSDGHGQLGVLFLGPPALSDRCVLVPFGGPSLQTRPGPAGGRLPRPTDTGWGGVTT